MSVDSPNSCSSSRNSCESARNRLPSCCYSYVCRSCLGIFVISQILIKSIFQNWWNQCFFSSKTVTPVIDTQNIIYFIKCIINSISKIWLIKFILIRLLLRITLPLFWTLEWRLVSGSEILCGCHASWESGIDTSLVRLFFPLPVLKRQSNG